MLEHINTVTKLLQFKFDGNSIIEEKISARLMRGLPLKNCYRAGNGYAVRLGLGGRQWELGKHRERACAVRFADMAIVYFWNYRTTRKLPPSDVDVNLTVELAKNDLQIYSQCKVLLDDFAARLIEKGVIKKLVAPGEEVYDYTSARVPVFKHLQALTEAVALVEKNNTNLTQHFSQANNALYELKTSLRNIDRILTQ